MPDDAAGWPKPDSKTPVSLVDPAQLLHAHLTRSLCASVWVKERVRERHREWSLNALVEFWTAVILRAPTSLREALEASQRAGRVYGPVPDTSAGAFFERCQTLHWRFFAEVFQGFVASVTPEAPAVYAQGLAGLRERFAGVWVIDGSRLDAIRHRLKLLWRQRAVILPGALWVAYDLFRGVLQRVEFTADAAQAELERATTGLDGIPADTLLVGDRLYPVPVFWAALAERRLWGLARRNRLVRVRRVVLLGMGVLPDGEVTDEVVEAGSGQTAPVVRLRRIRGRQGRRILDLLTNVLDPGRLSAAEALALYPLRWSVERVFYDLKEVLNLHQFYAGNPNAVAMQVYAAAIVHVAMRVAQGRVAQAAGIAGEAISPAKFSVRAAQASIALAKQDLFECRTDALNPGQTVRYPSVAEIPELWTTLGVILVERRRGPRRQRRFCAARRRWKSFKHVPGGRALT